MESRISVHKKQKGLLSDAVMEDEARIPRHPEPGHRGGTDWVSLTAVEFLAYMVPHELTGRDAPVLVRAGQLRRLLQLAGRVGTPRETDWYA